MFRRGTAIQISWQVKLTSEFVRPDLELSSDSIDFGHVIVGQVKRITIKLPGCVFKTKQACFKHHAQYRMGPH